MPCAWFSHWNQAATPSMPVLSALRILLVHLHQERARLDAPLLLEREQGPLLVPFDREAAQEIAPGTLEVRERDADRPGLLVLGLERHLVVRPFGIAARERRL